LRGSFSRRLAALAGAERVAYVDIDVHHGVEQAAFYDDPRVLTISLHEHPATLARHRAAVRDGPAGGASDLILFSKTELDRTE